MKDVGSITVVGLGPGRFGLITLESMEAVTSGRSLLLRTAVHPSVSELKRRGIPFTSYDSWYEKAQSFEALYHAIAEDLTARARAGEEIVYAYARYAQQQGVPQRPGYLQESMPILRRDLIALISDLLGGDKNAFYRARNEEDPEVKAALDRLTSDDWRPTK